VGNLVIADTGNSRIRVVAASSGTFYGQAMTAGDIYTVAGDGTRGYLGDGGPPTSAKIREPGDVAVDQPGNLVIADTGNSRIRVVAAASGTFYGHPMTAGDIYTTAGNGLQLSGDRGTALNAELALHANPLVPTRCWRQAAWQCPHQGITRSTTALRCDWWPLPRVPSLAKP
jgi:hypothetical protein